MGCFCWQNSCHAYYNSSAIFDINQMLSLQEIQAQVQRREAARGLGWNHLIRVLDARLSVRGLREENRKWTGTPRPASSMTLRLNRTMWRVNCSLENKKLAQNGSSASSASDVFPLPPAGPHLTLCIQRGFRSFLCFISCVLSWNVLYYLHNKIPSQTVTRLSDRAVIYIYQQNPVDVGSFPHRGTLKGSA